MSDKFDGRLAERFYNLSLDGGADEETGSVTENGMWYGRFNMRRAVVILSEDSQGFVYAHTCLHDEADNVWAECLDETNPEPTPDESDYVMSDVREGVAVSNEGKHLGTFDDRETAEDAIREDGNAHNVRPNVWFVSDHGNAHLVEDFRWD
jgi:hypothetical protein